MGPVVVLTLKMLLNDILSVHVEMIKVKFHVVIEGSIMDQSINIQEFFEHAHTLIIGSMHQISSYILENMNQVSEKRLIIYNFKNKNIYLGEFGKQLSVYFFIENTDDIHILESILNNFRIKKIFILGLSAGISDKNMNLGDVLIADGIVNIERSKIQNEYNYKEEKSLYCLSLETNSIVDKLQRNENVNIHIGLLGTSNIIFKERNEVLNFNRKIKAVDCELFGLYSFLATCDIKDWVVLSGIADIYDYIKRDNTLKSAVKNCVDVCESLVRLSGLNEMQSAKNIFISSTCYDLYDIRAELAYFLKNQNRQVMWSESVDFPVDYTIHSHDVCLNNVKKSDLMILIIDKRYGGIYAGNAYPSRNISITQYEVEIAKEMGIPVVTFVRNTTWVEKAIYKHNKRKGIDIIPFYADKIEVFDLIEYIQHSNANWIYQFENSIDLKLKLETILSNILYMK